MHKVLASTLLASTSILLALPAQAGGQFSVAYERPAHVAATALHPIPSNDYGVSGETIYPHHLGSAPRRAAYAKSGAVALPQKAQARIAQTAHTAQPVHYVQPQVQVKPTYQVNYQTQAVQVPHTSYTTKKVPYTYSVTVPVQKVVTVPVTQQVTGYRQVTVPSQGYATKYITVPQYSKSYEVWQHYNTPSVPVSHVPGYGVQQAQPSSYQGQYQARTQYQVQPANGSGALYYPHGNK